jgi:hypothetical protein
MTDTTKLLTELARLDPELCRHAGQGFRFKVSDCRTLYTSGVIPSGSSILPELFYALIGRLTAAKLSYVLGLLPDDERVSAHIINGMCATSGVDGEIALALLQAYLKYCECSSG